MLLNRRSFSAAALALMALPLPGRAQGSDWRWTDTQRSARSLPLRLRLPAGDAPAPLILFSHGLGGNLDAGSAWVEAWVSAGFATLNLQHPGSDTETLREGGVRGLRRAASGEQLRTRAQDVRFVLDELQRRKNEFPRLRLDTIGLAGHSFGAHTTMAVAGQFDGMADARPRAFAAFSPSPPRLQRGFADIRRPVLCLTGSLDGNPLGDEKTGDYRRGAYDALPAGDKAELWLDGADHMTFGGQPRERGLRGQRPEAATAQAPRHESLIVSASSDWWRAQLLEDAAARRRLAQAPLGLGSADAWRRG